MTHKQQQQATFVQVFCIFFQSNLDRLKQISKLSGEDIKEQGVAGLLDEVFVMKAILRSQLWLYNALPDEDKQALYNDENKALIDSLHSKDNYDQN